MKQHNGQRPMDDPRYRRLTKQGYTFRLYLWRRKVSAIKREQVLALFARMPNNPHPWDERITP